MKVSPRRATVLLGAATTIACLGFAPAALANGGSTPPHRTVHVSGEQIPIVNEPGFYTMTGDLVGKWEYKPVAPPLKDVPTLYSEAGTETFVGCIDRNKNGTCGPRDYNGELETTFLYWASFKLDKNGNRGDLIVGQCIHPITGGKGAFAGARGLIKMVDTPLDTGVVRTTYVGNVELGAVPSEAKSAISTATRSGAAASTGSSSTRQGC